MANQHHKLRGLITKYGFGKGMISYVDDIFNQRMCFKCYHIILLKREKVKCPSTDDTRSIAFRLATENDIDELKLQPDLYINPTMVRNFEEGDSCLLTYVDNELAGYTWAHLRGRPLLDPGFRLKIPDSLIYNYASLTLPKFRGINLQGLRHYELFNQAQWKDRIGALGYVSYVNWRSLRGVKKSGYEEIGKLWMLGTRERYKIFLSRSLREYGIETI